MKLQTRTATCQQPLWISQEIRDPGDVLRPALLAAPILEWRSPVALRLGRLVRAEVFGVDVFEELAEAFDLFLLAILFDLNACLVE